MSARARSTVRASAAAGRVIARSGRPSDSVKYWLIFSTSSSAFSWNANGLSISRASMGSGRPEKISRWTPSIPVVVSPEPMITSRRGTREA
jgi:hypothetical protein